LYPESAAVFVEVRGWWVWGWRFGYDL